MRASRTSPLWAITSYFNPAGYRNRLWNYQVFRERLQIPLIAVEASFDGTFELGKDDADVLIQLEGGSVLWQKERLLNIALAHLPAECRAVAWIDCDVLFERRDWPSLALEALEQHQLVHLFQERCDLPPEWNGDLPPVGEGADGVESVVSLLARGLATDEDIGDNCAGLSGRSSRGFGWAARREMLDEHGFYDACILGGGDVAILCAAMGRFHLPKAAFRMNAEAERHYLAWARPFYETVRGSVGNIDARLFHLWHGQRKDRRNDERFEILRSAAFDPFADITIGDQGCWVWGSEKPILHNRIRDYFHSRNEDALPSITEDCRVAAV